MAGRDQIFHKDLGRDRSLEALYHEHLTYDTETQDVVQHVGISEKRNVVELFSSFASKVHLCGRFRYLVEIIYLCLGRYVRRERYVIKKKFDRDDYDTGDDDGLSFKYQVRENGSLLYIKEKIDSLRDYMRANATIIDGYEDDLHSEQYSMPLATIQACEDYLETLKEMHRWADALIDILRQLHKKAVATRNAIAIYNNYLADYLNDLKEEGGLEEIQSRPVTRIEIFGDDGEIFACRFKGNGATAELIFEQIDLQLETVVGEEE